MEARLELAWQGSPRHIGVGFLPEHRQAVDPAEILRIGVSHDHQLSAHGGPEPEPQRRNDLQRLLNR